MRSNSIAFSQDLTQSITEIIRNSLFPPQTETNKTDTIATAEDFTEVPIRVPFWQYVEETANIKLDAWQVHLCDRLEKLVNQRGQRLMIHKPPQFGGSVIVAQRFVPYLLGHRPSLRCKIACYNIKRATRHTSTAKQIMAFHAHLKYFPEEATHVRPTAPEAEWSTTARLARYDSQPSYHALGLDSGFTGDGADYLAIDDPYASPNDAKSEAVNGKVCRFLPDTAYPRLNEDTNIVMMFHRYTEDDLAGTTLDQDEDQRWEYLRYAAVADGDYHHEATNRTFPDPLGRKPGEYLSARRAPEWYEAQKRNTYVWLSQFLGRPKASDGSVFECTKIQFIEGVPKTCRRFVRAWDLAATKDGGDWTAGVLMGYDEADNTVVVCDLARGQWASHERDHHILLCAHKDPAGTTISLPQDPAQAGKSQAESFRIKFAAFSLSIQSVGGDKVTRADPFASNMGLGGIKIVKAAWNRAMLRELEAFPNGATDDIVDALADGYNFLSHRGGWGFS